MLPLMDYFGAKHAKDGAKNDISYEVVRGEVLDVPVLNEATGYMNARLQKL